MDESWRKRMGMPSPKPKFFGLKSASDGSSSLDSINFSDVFGGPPRTVLSRQFSAEEFSRQTFSFEEVFQQSFKPPAIETSNSRNLPDFKIPAGGGGLKNNEEFYSDIFGDLRRSRSRSYQSVTNSYSKSKSASSSVVSSDEISPFPSAVVDEDVPSFPSKLRPINIWSKWNSESTMHEVRQMPEMVPDFSPKHCSYFENKNLETERRENFRSSHSGCSKNVSSSESIFCEPSLHCSIKVSVGDLQLNSPSSDVSSVCHDRDTDQVGAHLEQLTREQIFEQLADDEVMSSYVIEINYDDNREGKDEYQGIDEAIAWAKERYQAPSLEKECSLEEHDQEDPAELQEKTNINHASGMRDGTGSTLSLLYKKRPEDLAIEKEKQLERDLELEFLDEDVRLWSAGKEANVRLLLSTLHHILWPNSGWCAMPSSNLKENADVKRAYQKARLCLHPDKLQQRGATFPQKYVAEKAFPLLQDAWAAFISKDVF